MCAQLSVYHGIVYPYDTPNRVLHSIGSLTYAVPDKSANVQNNPASLFFIQNPRIYISFNQEISKYSYSQWRYNREIEKSKNLPVRYNTYPGSVSGALPFNLLKKSFVLGVSLNKIHSPEYEIWEPINSDYPEFIFDHHRKGNVWNAAVGICYRLSSDTNIALGWTKWFGNWSWPNENTIQPISSSGNFRYLGNAVNIGYLKQSQKLSYCFIFHLPFTLMKADNVSVYGGQRTESYTITLKQHFNGAFKAGIAYRWSDHFLLSAGYRYQEFVSQKQTFIREGSFNYTKKEEYEMSNQISLAGEYSFLIRNIKFPLYLACWLNWQPKAASSSFGHQVFWSDDNINPVNHIAFGLNMPLFSLMLFLTCQWNQSSINYSIAENPRRPSARIPASYKANKSTFLFNIGVSYDYK